MAIADSKYDKTNALMIGDAPGDMRAAQDNDILYFPINPNGEEKSWEEFYHQAAERFRAGEYAGEYEKALIAAFEKLLPDIPPWK